MVVRQALFAGSSRKVTQKPARLLPEMAFIGRSNVGKSSLINMLCGKKGLAHTSSTPGKTLLVNHFLVNDSWYLVDLPGYGYAKISKSGREKLEKTINDYLVRSRELVNLFVLLDSRLDIQQIDLDFMMELARTGIPFSIVYTKCDKLGVNALQKQLDKNGETLLQYWEELPPVFRSSSETGLGREDILSYIEQILTTINHNNGTVRA